MPETLQIKSVNPLINEILDQVHGLWRFRWIALGAAAAVAAVGSLIVSALPDRYEAAASVFVDTRTALKPALQGLTVEQDVDSQVNFVRQSLLAGAQLRRLAQDSGVLPPSNIDPRLQEQLIGDMGNRIDLTVHSANGRDEDIRTAGSIYSIVYQDRDRPRALRVVSMLLDSFVSETLGGKRKGAENAQQFLETQLRDYDKRLRAAEDRLADFKSRHIGLMPTEQGGYFAQLQKEEEAVAGLKTKLAEAESRRAALSRQLRGDVAVAATAPGQPVRASGVAGAALDLSSRIDEAQARLDDLLLRFTDQHPDVIAARETLENLKKRRAAEIQSLREGDATAAAVSGASRNPVYQSIQLALNQVDVDIADLKTELGQHESKVRELRRFLDSAPQVEAEFAELNRDYDVNKAQYTALLANLQKARLGERADSAGSVRFEIVQPPSAGLRPVWPQRLKLLTETLLAALAAGAGLAYALNYLNPVVRSANVLTRALGVPLLGQVGVAFPERARAARHREVLRLSVAGCCLAVAFAIGVVANLQGYRLSFTALKRLVGS